jgi:hypothetical protein
LLQFALKGAEFFHCHWLPFPKGNRLFQRWESTATQDFPPLLRERGTSYPIGEQVVNCGFLKMALLMMCFVAIVVASCAPHSLGSNLPYFHRPVRPYSSNFAGKKVM